MNYQRYKIDKTKIAVPYEKGNYFLLIRAKLHGIKRKTHEATEKGSHIAISWPFLT